MSKREALVREIAKLFLKYSLDDWRIVITMLRGGGSKYSAISRSIEEIASKARSKKDRTAKTSAAKGDSPARRSTPMTLDLHRAKFLSKMKKELNSKRQKWKLPNIRNIYAQFGGKEQLPSNRREAIRTLTAQIARAPDEVFLVAERDLSRRYLDVRDDYAKWFKIIYEPTEGIRDEHLNYPSSSISEKTNRKAFSEVNSRISKNLEGRIRKAILNRPFKLVYNPLTNASKQITFLNDGSIGDGRNQNEANWRINQGRLELIDQGGDVHSRFVLSNDGFSFHHTNDPDTRSIKDQQLIGVSQKQ